MIKVKSHKLIINLLSAISICIALISLLVGLFNVIYIKTYVKGMSMYPTLNAQVLDNDKRDKIYINRFAKTNINDVIVLDVRNNSNFDSDYIVKRLVAVEGDVVNIIFDDEKRTYDLVVSGKLLYSRPEKFGGYNTVDCFNSYVEEHKLDSSRISDAGVIIKSGEVFILGDNWNNSRDSALVGPISKKHIIGRVDIVVKPNDNTLKCILKRIFL